jgi:isopentenyl-diphosphate Delta-isomerase
MTDDSIRQRKLDHLELAMSDDMKALSDPGWSDVNLMPISLPTVNPAEVDLNTEFLGANLWAPIFIAGMTGGHPDVEKVNGALASAAEEHKVAIGVGSQRAALIDPELVQSFSIVRQRAPGAFICGNIGISQIVEKSANDDMLHQLVDMIEANALAVHINVLQELVQPEGSIELERVYEALADMIAASPVPVIFKETGCGFDQKTAQRLAQIGAAAIDVGGAGGTSFTQIEGIRASQANDIRGTRLAETFASWGIPTTLSVLEVRNAGLPVIATGGIRNGLEAAKALSLGAQMAGIGRQMLSAALKGPDAASQELANIIEEIRISLCLCDCRSIADFASHDPVLSGKTAAWAQRHK